VVFHIDAELNESSVDDVNRTEDRIVSRWRTVAGDSDSQLRDRVNEVLRPLGYETLLVVIKRANSIALYFISTTLPALTSVHDLWRSGQLKDTVMELFTLLAEATRQVLVKKLPWPLTDYERSLGFFRYERSLGFFPSVQGKTNNFITN